MLFRLCRCVLLLAAALLFPSFAAAAPASAPVVSLPKLAFRDRTLANGLRVLSLEDHQSPTVAIQVWYRVGSKDDPAGRSGFAHLFEHLLFKSTRNMKSEMLDRLTEDVGGQNNAYTSSDVTVYHETVPSHYLETLLWAEADRMVNLNVDEANFASERDVVKEEFRQGVLAPPYGLLGERIEQLSWTTHPYKRPTIGNLAELNAARLSDVRAFYATFYRPDNAVLIVAGDFSPPQLDAWVDKYFGRLAKPEGAVPRVAISEPPRSGEKRFGETAPNVPLPAVVLSFLAPPAKSEDAFALEIAQQILSGGESSRLYRSLVYEQQIASEAYAYADLREDAGLFVAQITLAGGKTPAAGEKALLAQLAKIQTVPVTPAELVRAKNQLLAQVLRERETSEGKADALGRAAVQLGDAKRLNTDIGKLLSVTAADVQRVMRKYLVPSNRVVITYTAGKASPPPAPPTLGGEDSVGRTSPAGRDWPAGRNVAAGQATEPGQTLSSPPPPTAPRLVTLPQPVEKTLANGLRVLVVPRRGSGLVSAELLVKNAGGANDPASKSGLASLAAALLTKGTPTRSAPVIAETIEALGASLNAGVGWDAASVSLDSLAGRLNEALPIFADVVLRPAFAPGEIARLRAQTLDELAVSLREPGTLARYAAARVVFGGGSYGHPLNGTPASLKRVARADVGAFHRARFRPDASVLVFAGDIAPADGFALAARHFGAWKKPLGKPVAPLAQAPLPAAKARVLVIDKPDAGQAAVIVARWGVARTDTPPYFAALVANSVLGGGYSSRINQEVRIKRGLSYGAGSRLDARAFVGPFTASSQTKNESAGAVARLLVDQLAGLATAPLLPAELTPRKAVLLGGFARSLETGAGLAGQVASLALYNLPLAALGRFTARVGAVAEADVKRVAATTLAAKSAWVVIVGDAKRFLPDLKKRFAGTPITVLPVSDVDFDQADLRRR